MIPCLAVDYKQDQESQDNQDGDADAKLPVDPNGKFVRLPSWPAIWDCSKCAKLDYYSTTANLTF